MDRLQAVDSVQSRTRQAAPVGNPPARDDDSSAAPPLLTVPHFDVVDAPDRHTDAASVVDPLSHTTNLTGGLRSALRLGRGVLASLVDGDTIVGVCPFLKPSASVDAITYLCDVEDIALQVGIGCDQTQREAGLEAAHGLEDRKENGPRIECANHSGGRGLSV